MHQKNISQIIDGKKIAKDVCQEVKNEIQTLGIQPKIVTVLVGNNPASQIYVGHKEKKALELGIDFQLIKLEDTIKERELIEKIHQLNNDKTIDGYIVQLPLPKNIDQHKIIDSIDPLKDIDGFHPQNQGNALIGNKNALSPCTPAGIMEIFKRENILLKGKIIVVVGSSNIVGKPMVNMLINEQATVINCNSETNKEDMKTLTRKADIVISATGVPKLIQADMLGPETIVIDVGITKDENGKICGDADFENIIAQGNKITPVPGGVGPMTVAMLMKNSLKAYKIKKRILG